MSELAELTSDRGKIISQVRDALPRLEGRRKVVWTCTTIEHAQQVDAALLSMGEQSLPVHSKVRDVDYSMDCFEQGHFRHAVSVMMLTEGIDIPSVDAICLMRPTRSPTLAVQTVGRGLRLHPGKKDCVVLDYGQVIANCGPINDPYLKKEGAGRTSLAHKPTIRICPSCLEYVPIDIAICPKCGHEDKKVVDRLKALTRKAAMDELLASREPETFEVAAVSCSQHRSMKGNNCVKLRFVLRGRLNPFFLYGSNHPYSWGKFTEVFYKLTPFRFGGFDEVFENAERIGEHLETPKSVTIKRDGDFEKLISMQT